MTLIQGRLALKTMYLLERFTPKNCPKCNRPFFRENLNFAVENGKPVAIICLGDKEKGKDCGARVERKAHEMVCVSHYTAAIDKVHEGFVNFQIVKMPVDTKDFSIVPVTIGAFALMKNAEKMLGREFKIS